MNIKNLRDDKFYRKMDVWCENLIKFADSYHDFLNKKVDLFTEYLSRFGDWFLNLLTAFSDFLMEYYKVARYLTIPLHWIWIYLWHYFDGYDGNIELLDLEGVHYIQALPGGGKSTLQWQKMYDYGKLTGKCSYVTTRMEKVKYDELGQPFVYHYHFDLEEFWGQMNEDDKFGSQLKYFDNETATAIVIDELHVLNNNRNNRTKEYNRTFIPMINSFVLMRHDGMKWILVSSQMPKNDTQIMSLLKTYNRVQIKKGFVYSKWLDDGKFVRRIKGWTIRTYSVAAENDYLKLEKRKKWFKTATVDFSDFESLNMAKSQGDIPVDRRAVLQ